MDISVETMQMAEDILSSIDANEEFMEHHGVKGQKHGVRRYQNDDGSLTALGRQHYGIFGRLRSHFNPAERGYRAAEKQQQQQQKIAVKKAKYAGDIKKMMKKRKYFTDEEIERKIDTDTRLQQKRNHLNELMRADKIKRKEEKMAEKERKEAIKESKLQQDLQKEAIKSQEKQHKLEQKTLLDVQKQKDKAQAEREQAAREYQTQQQIAKGKTLLGRLQKGAQMTAAVMGIVSNASKTAGIFKEMGFNLKKVNEAAKKINEAKEAIKKADPEKPKTEAPKPEEQKSQIKYNKEAVERAKAESHKKAVEEWNDWQKQNRDKFEYWEKHNRDWLNTRDAKLKWDKEYSAYQSEQARKERAGWWDKLYNRQAKGSSAPNGVKPALGVGTTTSASQNNNPPKIQPPKIQASNINKNGVKPAPGVGTTNSIENKPEAQSPQSNQNGVTTATQKQAQAATEKAREIKQQVAQIKAKSNGPVSDTAKFVSSISTTKLAQMLSGIVPNDLTPTGINLGSYLGNGKATSFTEEYKKSPKMMRKQRYGNVKHDDIEDAGEIEDAE